MSREGTDDRIRRASADVFALRRMGQELIDQADQMIDELIAIAIEVRVEKKQVEWLDVPIVPVLASEEEGINE